MLVVLFVFSLLRVVVLCCPVRVFRRSKTKGKSSIDERFATASNTHGSSKCERAARVLPIRLGVKHQSIATAKLDDDHEARIQRYNEKKKKRERVTVLIEHLFETMKIVCCVFSWRGRDCDASGEACVFARGSPPSHNGHLFLVRVTPSGVSAAVSRLHPYSRNVFHPLQKQTKQ